MERVILSKIWTYIPEKAIGTEQSIAIKLICKMHLIRTLDRKLYRDLVMFRP